MLNSLTIFINNISPDNIISWKKLLESHPYNTVFQSYEMYLFYEKVQNFEPFLFYAKDDNGTCIGTLLAVMIREGKGLKGYFSSRVVVYGGPLISDREDKLLILDNLLSTLVSTLKNRSLFIQFRNFFEWDKKEKEIFSQHGFHFKDRLNSIIETVEKEKVWRGINESKRRQIKKGLKSAVKIAKPENEAEMKVFYSLLKELYQTKVKKPLPAWSFFKEFYNLSSNGTLGVVLLVKKEEKIIGGILSPVTANKNIYEWYVVGLDKAFKHCYPSVLATWAPINYAIENNLQYFDFMGLGTPGKEYGVRDFKMKFGGKIVNYGRFGRRNNKILYPMAEFGYTICRAVPFKILKS